MALLPALLVVLLLEALAAVSLDAAAARSRMVADRRLAIEGDLALETAIARARVVHDTTIAAVGPGARLSLTPPSVAGWEVRVDASREVASALVRLDVSVIRRDLAGQPRAARRGTLLLVAGAADTAIVLDDRPRS